MDEIFENLGTTIAEYTANKQAPRGKPDSTNYSTLRNREWRERTKQKLAKLELRVQPEWETPLEYMLRIMRDPTQPVARRCKMAIAAAPYCHPNLSRVPAEERLGKKEQQSIAADEAAEGKFAPAPTPLRLITKE